jgi:hypothetical protein
MHRSRTWVCGECLSTGDPIRRECRNPYCPASPLFEWDSLAGELWLADWRARRLARALGVVP